MAYTFGVNFAALLAEYESDRAGRVVTEAYLDPKGIPTGPGGMTFHQDGRLIRIGDRWTHEEALALIAWGKKQFAAEVEQALPPHCVPTQNQFDALGFFAWNNGSDVLTGTSVAEALAANPTRWEEVARAMTIYRRMTLWGGTTGPDGSPVKDPNGNVMAAGLSWYKAMRGIYRRSCATACLLLSLDWREATAPARVHMSKRADWIDAERRWVDTVVDQTSWKAIQDVARQQPLPDQPAAWKIVGKVTEKPKDIDRHVVRVQGREIELPDEWSLWTANAQTEWMNREMNQHLKEEAPVNTTVSSTSEAAEKRDTAPAAPSAKPKTKTTKATPVPVDSVPYLDETAKAAPKVKPIEESQRGTGYARQKQAEAIGTVAVGGWMADQMGLVKPILDFTSKYTPSQIAVGAALIGVPTVGLWYYGKWRRRKGEADADSLLG